MAYLTREDGERFIIPSYRDVLSAKKLSLLRREIMLLSANYGEYITLQRKNINQYEVAFSPDPGYLLGESIWAFFKRPPDLIYCEQIPNTFEAILVIVKSGSVYLDGSFPLDAIADELVIFRTQQNYFDIYIYGDVPISETPEEGKFTFDSASVKSFNVLEQPVFPTLPVNKAFQLQLVDTVLKSTGLGGVTLKQIAIGAGIIALIVLAWFYLTSHKAELPQVIVQATNPYQTYLVTLTTPDPTTEISWIANSIRLFGTIPGWSVTELKYVDGKLDGLVKSRGASTHLLFDWAQHNNAVINVETTGFHVVLNANLSSRPVPTTINLLNSVIAALVDSVAVVFPGNNLDLGPEISKGRYKERQVNIKFTEIPLTTFNLIGQQLKNLPLVLMTVAIKIDDYGNMNGNIMLRALGN